MITRHEKIQIEKAGAIVVRCMKKLRHQGLSYAEIAERSGMRIQRISELVHGKRKMTKYRLKRLLKIDDIREKAEKGRNRELISGIN